MKRTVVLFLAMAVTVGLLVGTARIVAAKALDEQMLSGQLHIIWGDRSSDNAAGPREAVRFVLVDEAGKSFSLDMTAVVGGPGGVLSLNRQFVELEGQWRQQGTQSPLAEGKTSGGAPAFRVRSIRRALAPMAFQSSAEAMPNAAIVVGTQRWVTVLCRFADATGITPRERGWFDQLMLGNDYPSMNHYWRELSFGQVDLTGSQVAGWYNLPRPHSYYVYDVNGVQGGGFDFSRASEDCAAVADAEVHFPDFQGINFVFNQDTGCCGWGGSWTLPLDGQTRAYGATWVTAHTSVGQSVWGHEMGHGFGLPHSSGPYNTPYDSAWDVMSAQWWGCGTVQGSHPVFHCIGQHTIGWHKAMLGWVPPDRIYLAGPGSSQTIEIQSLSSGAGSGYLMGRVPINGSSTEFYTVEVRQRLGYDSILPGDAVIIHHVDTGRWDRQAQVVDPDNNGNPNDAGAMWVVGDVFTANNGIKVSVVGITANGFQVAVENGGSITPPPPPPTSFVLNVAKNGNGIVTAAGINCGSDCQEQFPSGTVVALTAIPDSGWTFVGWSGDADCADGQVTLSRDIACTVTFGRTPAPDLVGQFTSLTKKVKKGHGKVSFTVHVTNAGDQPAQTPDKKVYVALYLSSDAVLDGSDQYLTTVSAKAKKGLAPWQSVAAKGKVTLPEPSSGMFLIAVIDPWNHVAESDEYNNVVAIPIP